MCFYRSDAETDCSRDKRRQLISNEKISALHLMHGSGIVDLEAIGRCILCGVFTPYKLLH